MSLGLLESEVSKLGGVGEGFGEVFGSGFEMFFQVIGVVFGKKGKEFLSPPLLCLLRLGPVVVCFSVV